MTQFEQIKQMSIEEMANFFAMYTDRMCIGCDVCHMKKYCEYPVNPCNKTALDWLNSKVEN